MQRFNIPYGRVSRRNNERRVIVDPEDDRLLTVKDFEEERRGAPPRNSTNAALQVTEVVLQEAPDAAFKDDAPRS
ncbi:hypothetical protein L596_029478 [Steinernema carpocapsae]|uniref:Uncharacterized protein n=1 Tax=Steinernema carpocapsae TaxID=34508 RepID=A0A4U5LUS0_STECR|nr:hypothetical protein L596_029478 [Steinernema carpocapsae]